jgi:eukaryotic-like serine/threonine-protein kinase
MTVVDAKSGADDPEDQKAGLWRVGQVDFDELSFELRVAGAKVSVERVPLRVLLALLRAGGRVVTADQLLATIWHRSRDTISRNAVSNAIGKLRKALGVHGQNLIEVLPQTGYRLTVEPVWVEQPAWERYWICGAPVPGAPGWRLAQNLRTLDGAAVWTADGPGGQRAVFKFARHQDGHWAALRREMRIARLLLQRLGPLPEFALPDEARLDRPPYFLRSPWRGLDLRRTAELGGGLAALPLVQRLAWVAGIASALTVAHSVGVLHKDLKPDNVLFDPSQAASESGGVCLIDFGSGEMHRPTPEPVPSVSVAAAGPDERGSRQTWMYLAPECLAGQPATVGSDLYACGVMLYQCVVGDFDRPIPPTWAQEVDDPLLREDIELATHGDPARRIGSARELAQRLRGLPERRLARERDQAIEAEHARLAARWELSRARRPWMLAAVACLVLGTGVSLYFARDAARQRDEARIQYLRAQTINDFLVVGFLQAANPATGGDANITLRDAMRKAGQRLDAELQTAPVAAAATHQAIGNHFLALLELGDALPHFRRAVQITEAEFGARSDSALSAQCDLAAALAFSGIGQDEVHDLARQALVAVREPQGLSLATRCKCHQLLGTLAQSRGDRRDAVAHFQKMTDLADQNPAATARQKGLARSVLGYSLVDSGQSGLGISLLQRVVQDFQRQWGEEHYDTLSANYMLARALARDGQMAEARDLYARILPIYQARFGRGSPLVQRVRASAASVEAVMQARAKPTGVGSP